MKLFSEIKNLLKSKSLITTSDSITSEEKETYILMMGWEQSLLKDGIYIHSDHPYYGHVYIGFCLDDAYDLEINAH